MVVDGPPAGGTVLTLSHWPHSPTPKGLADDLSAQIVFKYLRSPSRRWPGAPLVSNDHLDQDGLVSLYAMVEPDDALAREGPLVDVASAGDFALFSSRDAARTSFGLATLSDPDRSPLSGVPTDPALYAERCAVLYEELLARLPAMLRATERHRSLWEEEDACFEASERAFENGEVSIEEVPDVDLAVVSVAKTLDLPGLATRFAYSVPAWVHPASVNNRTRRLRVLLARGRRYRVVFRYETWVKLVSRRPLARVDLAPLAELLNGEEAGSARWSFDAVGALEPLLFVGSAPGSDAERALNGEESSLDKERLVALIASFLEGAAPAWDPYSDR